MPKQAAGRESEAALTALFARVSRQAEHAILPINDCAVAGDDRLPAFYCVHALSGTGGSDFVPLARLMPDVRFFGIQAPARKMADTAFALNVASLADFYADMLVNAQEEGAFMLGGWSAGAVIALEVAQRLRTLHRREVSLLVSFDAAPENVATALRPWHPRYLWALARNLPQWARHDGIFNRNSPGYLPRSISQKTLSLGRALLLRARGEKLPEGHAVEGFMDIARFPLPQQMFMRRLYGALLRYQPSLYPGRVVVYEAAVNPPHRLRQVGNIWRNVAAATQVVRITGATHLTIMREPHVHAVARDLSRRIALVGG